MDENSYGWFGNWPTFQFVTQPQIGNTQVGVSMNAQQQQQSGISVNWSVGGTVVLALAIVFAMHYLGFRFVVGAGVGK